MMKNQAYFLLITLIILFSIHQASGQNNLKKGASQTNNVSFNTDFCGTDFFHNKKMKNDKENLTPLALVQTKYLKCLTPPSK